MPNQKAGRKSGRDQIAKLLGQRGLQGGFGHFFDDYPSDQLRSPSMLIELVKPVILLDCQRGNPAAHLRNLKDCGHRPQN